jgi:hypothetical protein
MPLIINGTVGGRFYNDEQIKASVLIDAFKVPAMNGKPRTFKLIEGTRVFRKDRSNPGEVLVTPGKMINPEFTVTTSEGTISLRYYTNRTPIPGGGGTYRYMPKKMTFIKGETMFYFGPERVEEYVWAYLHPQNAKSPFKKANKPPVYSYFDAEESAMAQMDFLGKKVDLMQIIATMKENELRMRAAGLTYIFNTRRISFSNAANPNISVAIIRNNLITALTQHEQKFIDAWGSADTSVVGIAKMAEALNIVEQKPISGGIEWRFHQNYGGARICTATKDQDSLSVLVGEITGQYQFYVPKLKNLIDVVGGDTPEVEDKAAVAPVKEKVVEKVVEKIVYRDAQPTGPLGKNEIDALPNLEFVEYAEKREIIALERTQSKVFKLNKKGDIERPLCKIEDKQRWKEEFAQYLNEEQGKTDRIDLTATLIKLK